MSPDVKTERAMYDGIVNEDMAERATNSNGVEMEATQSAEVKAGQKHADKSGDVSHKALSTASRKKKRVLWRGKSCFIALPLGGPESYGRHRPLSELEIKARLQYLEDAGYINGLDKEYNNGSAQTRQCFPDPEEDLRHLQAKSYAVRVPDPKVWAAHVNSVTEAKLRALGVSTGLDNSMRPPPPPRRSSAQNMSVNLSRRSTPGMPGYNSGPHSRAMSVISPHTVPVDLRSHASRHSVFAMPSGFQEQHHPQSLRGPSPALERFGSDTPPSNLSQLYSGMQLRGPSPLQSQDRSWTPSMHARHPSTTPGATFQHRPSSTSLANHFIPEVPENESEIIDMYKTQGPSPHVNAPDIIIPTPRGHRHNISQSFENDLLQAEALIERASEPYTHSNKQIPSLGHASRLSVAAPEFRFAPGSDASMNGAATNHGHVPAMGPFMVGPQGDWQFMPSNLNTSAPDPPVQSKSANRHKVAPSTFNFSFANTFQPGATAFQPASQSHNAGQQPIFGQVEVPDVPKAEHSQNVMNMVRTDSGKDLDMHEEDEHGRSVQSKTRQKRARQAGRGDEDDEALFAARPDSPVKQSEPSPSATKHEARELDHNDQARAVDKENQDPSHEQAKEHATTADPASHKSVLSALVSSALGHRPNASSMSASAKAYQPVPSLKDEQIQLPTTEDTTAPTVERGVKPEKDIGQHIRAPSDASRSSVSIHDQVEYLDDHGDGLRTDEPSFAELDAVMARMNDEDDNNKAKLPTHRQAESPAAKMQSPTHPVIERQSSRSAAPSPISIRSSVRSAAQSRSVSPLPDMLYQSFDAESPSIRRTRAPDVVTVQAKADGAEKSSLPPHASNVSWEELIGAAIRDQLKPLKASLRQMQTSINGLPIPMGLSPRRGSSLEKDSDADDEDDIIDSKFISRPVSRTKDKKLETMRAVVMDALAAHSADTVKAEDTLDLQETLLNMDANLALIASTSASPFDLDDIRIVVEDVMGNQSRAVVPYSAVETPRRMNHRKQVSELEGRLNETLAGAIEEANHRHAMEERERDAKRMLRLAEEEVALLRDTMSDKDRRINALTHECQHLKDRMSQHSEARQDLERHIEGLEAESEALETTLDEYRTSSNSWRQEIDQAKADNAELHATVQGLEAQLVESADVRESMRTKLDRIHSDMASAAGQLASEKSSWQSRLEESQRRCAVLEARSDAAFEQHSQQEDELRILRSQVAQNVLLNATLEQTLDAKMEAEAAYKGLQDAATDQQEIIASLRIQLLREQEGRQSEVQHLRVLIESTVAATEAKADARVTGLESQLSIAKQESANLQTILEGNKTRQEVMMKEDDELRRHAMKKLESMHDVALDELRARHDQDIRYLRVQHERTLADTTQNSQRSQLFYEQRLSLADDKSVHLNERIAHLEERLQIAQSAAQAAVTAAQAANAGPSTSAQLREPERISPQALRESILVLQEQLQEREGRIERLQSQIGALDTEAPGKLKERDIEITWLRELLANREDELSELIDSLSDAAYDPQAVRDTAIRIRANLQMEQQEKERLITAGSSITGQAIAGLSNFASPRAVQLAAAIGNWRTKSGGSVTASSPRGTPAPRRSERDSPSKAPPSTPSFFAGLMTPPGSHPRSSPSPRSPSAAAMASASRTLASAERGHRASIASSTNSPSPNTAILRQRLETRPISTRWQSYDEDASQGAVQQTLDEADHHQADDEVDASQADEDDISRSPSKSTRPMRSLADEMGEED